MAQTTKKDKGFSAEERAAMKERARELKATALAEEGLNAVLAKIGEMTGTDQILAERLHAIITSSAPSLTPKLWYGMPSYTKDGEIVCFFQSAQKFNTRYATLGFNEKANLDDGALWPVAYALTELTDAEEGKIAELVKRAAS